MWGSLWKRSKVSSEGSVASSSRRSSLRSARLGRLLQSPHPSEYPTWSSDVGHDDATHNAIPRAARFEKPHAATSMSFTGCRGNHATRESGGDPSRLGPESTLVSLRRAECTSQPTCLCGSPRSYRNGSCALESNVHAFHGLAPYRRSESGVRFWRCSNRSPSDRRSGTARRAAASTVAPAESSDSWRTVAILAQAIVAHAILA